jgi:hypothetical protein
VDDDLLAVLLLPVLGEERVVLLVELARRVVGDVEQLDVARLARDEGSSAQR